MLAPLCQLVFRLLQLLFQRLVLRVKEGKVSPEGLVLVRQLALHLVLRSRCLRFDKLQLLVKQKIIMNQL